MAPCRQVRRGPITRAMLSPLGDLLRRHDPDRFLTALFAPPERREALFALYAFNHELARAPVVASQPLLALIRLQWWREVVEGEAKSHEVATPLSAALAAGALQRDDLLPLIAAREVEAEREIGTLAEWQSWLMAGAGGLAVAAGRCLGGDGAAIEGLRLRGAAFAAAGVLQRGAVAGRQDAWLPWPQEVLAEAGIAAEEAGYLPPEEPRLAAARAILVGHVEGWLRQARRHPLPKALRPAALVSVLARRDLARLTAAPTGPRGFADRAAVLVAAMTGIGL